MLFIRSIRKFDFYFIVFVGFVGEKMSEISNVFEAKRKGKKSEAPLRTLCSCFSTHFGDIFGKM